jgi:hypothetical protein
MTDDDDGDNNETADYTNRDDDGETADYTNAHLSGRASERNCDGRTTACLNFGWGKNNNSVISLQNKQAAEVEDDYRYLSTEADDSEIFDTHLDTENGPISGERREHSDQP